MNKRKLQEFASWAKVNLETQIKSSLAKIGIYSGKDIKPSRIQGDITIIGELETSFPKEFYNQRESIVKRIQEDGYEHSIEQFASTWFNRLVALRFLEVHDYLEHGYKIFPRTDEQIPEILSKLNLVKHDLALDMEYCNQLSESSKFEDKEILYRYILFQQCNSLATSLPMLFSQEMEYLEYFIPTQLLFGDTIVTKIIEIDEQDFLADVEVIGWLYQFYIASKKDAVFASKKTITKDTLPAVTQLFTPDWIVKYMAENSIGRIWLESYPNSSLRDRMKYYVEETKQDNRVEEQLKEIRYSNVNPEDIKVIEPCSGSGHILVYCFDLLLDMYLEKGYSKRDIPRLIFKNNLVGLDIDQRATQLASFALVMRARSIDNRFFDEGRYVRAKVYEIIDSKSILNARYDRKSYRDILKEYNDKQWNGENQLTNDELQTIEYIVNLFENAKVIGSLLKVKSSNYLEIRNKLKINLKFNTVTDIFTDRFFSYEIVDLLEILRLAHYLSIKYDVMITNPPYCGISVLEDAPKRYLEINYPESKADMFAMFMDTCFTKKNGLLAMINQQSWMYLVSFKKIRAKLVKESYFISLVHLGSNAFSDIGGEVVQTCTFVLRKSKLHQYSFSIVDLTEIRDAIKKEVAFIEKNTNSYMYSNNHLNKENEYIFSYKNNTVINNFSEGVINDNCEVYRGPSLPNNSFLRYWFEVEHERTSCDYNEEKKWIFCMRGGGKTKWFDYPVEVVDRNILHNCSNYKTHSYSGVLWSDSRFGSPTIVAKLKPSNMPYESAVNLIKCTEEESLMFMALFNTSYYELFLKSLVNGQHFSPIYIKKLPYVKPIKYICNLVKIILQDHEILSKFDEINRDFLGYLNISESHYISQIYLKYEEVYKKTLKSICEAEHSIEERLMLDLKYDEIVSKKYRFNTLTTSSFIIRILSYFVGVLMGRYSLVEEGLIYAGGSFDNTRYGTFDIDKDGIIPIYSDISIEDGLVHRIIGLIKSIYGEEYYRENIDFIASALGKKSSETSEETLNRYLNEGFYVDHLQVYKKRPIYWMFSSGKKSGFKALIYMHRYDENTLAKINAGYFQPATTIIRNQISEIEKSINHALDHEKVQLERRRLQLVEQLDEATEYGQVLDYMANKYISIDLDDGVKVNYAKFQNIEVTTNNGKVTRDLLVSIK